MNLAHADANGRNTARTNAKPGRTNLVPCTLLLSFLLAAPIAMALEQPEYDVIAEFDDIEIRHYEPYIVAEVDVPNGNSGFRKLAGYIFGGNEQQEKMAMTAPVGSRESATPDRLTYSFVMERKYSLDTLPRPDNDEIRLLERPERIVAVRRFSGRWTDKNFRRHLDKLLQALEKAGIEPVGEPEQARYNSPFTPSFLRRNEVIIPVDWSKEPS